MRTGNVGIGFGDNLVNELYTTLADGGSCRVERIVSRGHNSPPGFWYDQDENEFVLLVKGAARMLLEGEAEERSLGPGDWLDIKAHVRHRVTWTDPTRPTIWVAVFYAESQARPRLNGP